ncbi:hypothetical protein ACFWXA_08635 [Streptomyces atroolivaceus]
MVQASGTEGPGGWRKSDIDLTGTSVAVRGGDGLSPETAAGRMLDAAFR